PAWDAGLRPGDEVVAVDGEETAIWQQVTMQLLGRLGETGERHISAIPAGQSAARDFIIPLQNLQAGSIEPNPIGSLGLVQYEIPPVLQDVLPDGAAEAAGLLPGDLIVSVNGEPVTGWVQWVDRVRASPELPLQVVVQRQAVPVELVVVPRAGDAGDGTQIGVIGASVQQFDLYGSLPPERIRQVNYNPLTAIGPALQNTWDNSVFVL